MFDLTAILIILAVETKNPKKLRYLCKAARPNLLKISRIILSYPLVDCFEFRACLALQRVWKNNKILRRSGYFKDCKPVFLLSYLMIYMLILESIWSSVIWMFCQQPCHSSISSQASVVVPKMLKAVSDHSPMKRFLEISCICS